MLAAVGSGESGDPALAHQLLEAGVQGAVGEGAQGAEHPAQSLAQLVAVHGRLVQQPKDGEVEDALAPSHVASRCIAPIHRHVIPRIACCPRDRPQRPACPLTWGAPSPSAPRSRESATPPRSPGRPPLPAVVEAVASLVVLGVLAIAGALVTAYVLTDVPEENAEATAQASIVSWSDGVEMGRFGVTNREAVDVSTLPEHVTRAVLAAEDRTSTRTTGSARAPSSAPPGTTCAAAPPRAARRSPSST